MVPLQCLAIRIIRKASTIASGCKAWRFRPHPLRMRNMSNLRADIAAFAKVIKEIGLKPN